MFVFFVQQFDRDIGRPSTGNTTAHYRQFLLCFGRQSFDNIWKLTVFTIVNGKLDLGEFELAIDFDTIGTLPTWNVLLQLGMSGSLPQFFFNQSPNYGADRLTFIISSVFAPLT